jgi:MT0933-like antitoxin protein
MGFDDALNKAKDYAGENPDQVNQGIDAATEQIKERTPDQVDEQVDAGADAAREKFGFGGDEQGK